LRPKFALDANGKKYLLEIVTTDTERSKGLGDREAMPANQGMLFVFEGVAVQCFWMKDMHFSIDIIWLDAEKRVVHIEKDVSPETYPRTFCPSKPAKYVIELNAGEASRASIRPGQKLSF
jgi:uncharacterized membrane protein (UPF0127 family)